MILPKDSYDREAYRQLSNSEFYSPQGKDLTTNTARILNNLLSYLRKRGFLSTREMHALQPKAKPQQRNFYLLPKMHKDAWPDPCMPPGRPIISDVNSVSRKCASLIDYFLSPLAKLNASFVRDSLHVIARLKDTEVSNDSILFTMDITSLYTNVPIDEGIECVGRSFLQHPDPKRPDATILTMLKLLLTNNDFYFRDKHYLQTHGTAMGSAYGASFANIFLGEWETRIFARNKVPAFWIRYIDDIFGVWNHSVDDLLLFVSFINKLHPKIKITLHYSLLSVSFLDLNLYKSHNNILHSVFFKPTHTFTILSPDSFHPPHVFRNILFGQLYRFLCLSSTFEDFQATRNKVTRRWIEQGYSRSQIRTAVAKVLTLTQRFPESFSPGFYSCECSTCICTFSFNPKAVTNLSTGDGYPILHRLTCSSPNVIYLIEWRNCSSRYVGQTSRPLHHRISEHLRNIRAGRATRVSAHFSDSCTSSDFSFTALEHCPNSRKRLLKENSWMRRLKTLVPDGLNEATNRNNALRLVLPWSDCARRVLRLAQQKLRSSDVTGSFTMHPNLRRKLITNH